MLIDKYDIAKLVKFSVNIADAEINPFILKAQRTLPVLENDQYNKFELLPKIDYQLYSAGEIIAAGSYREYDNAIWKAIAETTTTPGIAADGDVVVWEKLPDYTVYLLAVKRYLVFRAYGYFLVLHGLDVTQAGLTQQTGERFTPVSEQRRKDIIASNNSDLIAAENELFRFLKLYNYLPVSNECLPENLRKNRFGIGVAKNKYRE